ncbi:MAG: amidohydrolase family protein [Candidatus Thorarchaeota archaeon]
MDKLIIKNGLVYDPINNINGEKKDILIESGTIVDSFTNNKDIKEINANGKTVIPSAIDIHTHVASQQVNWVRLLGLNNAQFNEIWHGLTLDKIARDYVSMGYSFILEANTFPSLAKQTVFNFQQLPVLDKGMLLNISNMWPLELEFQRGKVEDMAVFLSDLLSKTYGFGFKVYNPFECEQWNLKELREDLAQQGRLYNFTALNVYENTVKCVELLGLPHSAHIHIEGYENEIGKENLFSVLNKIKSLNVGSNPKTSLALKREQILHVAHVNTYAIDGNNEEIIKFFNENQNFGMDLSFVGFNQLNPLITSDRRVINSMLTMDSIDSSKKLITSAVEFEGDLFASLRALSKDNYKDCTLWANALDIVLNIKNKQQISFSLNFPNYANLTDIPEITTWLVSKKARNRFMEGMNKDFLKDNTLQNNEETLNFSEFIIITRTAPAKSLGLGSIKGNLGVGADGDLNVLDVNFNEVDISENPDILKSALNNLEYVIKSGEIVKKQNELVLDNHGCIFWAKGKVDLKEKDYIMSKKKEFYEKYSSLFYDSLSVSVENKYLRLID